jgi:ribosomal protein S18 acetylase RimI-like enzyme
MVELRWMHPADEAVVRSATELFDSPIDPGALRTFLADPRHHLCLAFSDDQPVGFVSGVEMTHPDKGTEMFLYELGVDEVARRRGIGTALVRALSDLAQERGCYGMWVLTEDDNVAAMRTYAAAAPDERSAEVMFGWSFSRA